MTKKEWDAMSDEVKVHHLLQHDLEYRSRFFQDSHTMYHQVVIGGVLISGYHKTAQAAANEALQNVAGFVQQINY